jgi:hypothetical protein
MGKDCIEGFSGKSKFVDVANLELDIGNAFCRRLAPGARATSASEISIPVTCPGATRCASPTVIDPEPDPQSNKLIPGSKYGRKKAAWPAAVLLAWSFSVKASSSLYT